MADGLTPEHLEQIRRSMAMSTTITVPIAQELLDEVHRLRAIVARVDAEVERAIGRHPAALESRRR